MTTVLAPICLGCTHFTPDDLPDRLSCAAFPEGIPDDILDSSVDHREPVEGDNGILFEADSPESEAYAVEVFS